MRKEIDSLKASLLDLKKKFHEIEKSHEITDVKEHNEGVKNQIKEIQGRQKQAQQRF